MFLVALTKLDNILNLYGWKLNPSYFKLGFVEGIKGKSATTLINTLVGFHGRYGNSSTLHIHGYDKQLFQRYLANWLLLQ